VSAASPARPAGPVHDGRSRVELAKLRHELSHDGDDTTLDFLAALAPNEVRLLRERAAAARFTRHEGRFARLAGLTRLLPVALCARAAEAALGPLVSARTASVMEPEDAVRLASRISPDFLATLTTYLDPARSAAIVRELPEPLLVAVGRRMLARGEHLALGRFVGVVPTDANLAVVHDAPGLALLEIALYAEEPDALDAVVGALPDDALRRILVDAVDEGRADDAVLLLGNVGLDARARVFELLPELAEGHQRALVRAVVRRGAWTEVLPVLSLITPAALQHLVRVPEIADPALLAALVPQDGDVPLTPAVPPPWPAS